MYHLLNIMNLHLLYFVNFGANNIYEVQFNKEGSRIFETWNTYKICNVFVEFSIVWWKKNHTLIKLSKCPTAIESFGKFLTKMVLVFMKIKEFGCDACYPMLD